MKKIKLTVAALVAALVVSTAQAPKAEAGIILSPVGVGVVLFVLGVVHHNPYLIVLDADGSMSQSSLEATFAHTYPFIDNQDAIRNLAALVKEKAEIAAEKDKGGKEEPAKCDPKSTKCDAALASHKDKGGKEEPAKCDPKTEKCDASLADHKDKGGKEEPAKCDPKSTKCDAKIVIRLSADEVLAVLEPTGLADLQPESVQALIKDLE